MNWLVNGSGGLVLAVLCDTAVRHHSRLSELHQLVYEGILKWKCCWATSA
jgi:hypothetical protein